MLTVPTCSCLAFPKSRQLWRMAQLLWSVARIWIVELSFWVGGRIWLSLLSVNASLELTAILSPSDCTLLSFVLRNAIRFNRYVFDMRQSTTIFFAYYRFQADKVVGLDPSKNGGTLTVMQSYCHSDMLAVFSNSYHFPVSCLTIDEIHRWNETRHLCEKMWYSGLCHLLVSRQWVPGIFWVSISQVLGFDSVWGQGVKLLVIG
jgi:hypothetical protein